MATNRLPQSSLRLTDEGATVIRIELKFLQVLVTTMC